MKEKRGKPVSFRPDAVLERWFSVAKSVGLDVSDVINETLMTPVPDGYGEKNPVISTVIEAKMDNWLQRIKEIKEGKNRKK